MRWSHILVLAFLTATTQSGQSPRPSPPHISVSCVMGNHPYSVSEYQKNQSKLVPKDHDDFWIGGHDESDKTGCTIAVDDKLIWRGALTTAHPTSSTEAMAAIDEFRNVRAPQIVKEYRK